ncbi:Heterogeneous nuclear ribonucleoprotein K [Halotydeus destructor]|nr:Heterogeneous nuclear ribonucleoprotein K [Halotydeus destructor]
MSNSNGSCEEAVASGEDTMEATIKTESNNEEPETPDEDAKVEPEQCSNGSNKLEAEEAKETDANESEPPPAKRQRTSEDLEVRFLISSKEAGATIGKAGANINHLRKHYKASVTVPDCPGPERVLSIVSKEDILPDMLKDVINYMDDRVIGQKLNDKEVELRLLVHTSHAGGIIGRSGQKIRQLRDETKAAIKVFSQCCPQSTERVCALQGPPAVVIDAFKAVLDIIIASPTKGPVNLYDPFNFNMYVAPDYGGLAPEAASNMFKNQPRDVSSANRRPPPYDAALVGYKSPPENWARGSEPRDGRPRPRAAGPPPMAGQPPYQRWMGPADPYAENGASRRPGPPPGVDPHSVPQSFWSNLYHSESKLLPSSQYEQAPASFVTNPDGSATATLTVPNNIAGAIIGKAGNRIRLVRRDSGADVSINNGPGLDRTVTVKGSVDQVRRAYSMLQQNIAENSR